METEPVKPDLDGACIARLVPALLDEREATGLPDPVRDATSVVLLLLDGLGWLSMREHLSDLPVFAAMAGGPITTVLPSSTSAALTSLTTASAPSEHGITGIVLRVGDVTVHTLRWAAAGGATAPDPSVVQRRQPFGGRDVPVVTRAEFSGSGFTEAHLRGARMHGWRTTRMLVESCSRLVASGEPFVYGYYDGIDVVSHVTGTSSSEYRRELASADRLCGDLLDVLPATACLVVTADHGQVDLEERHWVDVDGLTPMVAAHAGDARCRFLYARAGAAAELLAAARELAGERAWVLERDRALDEGWFGPRTALGEERIGDVVLLGRDAAFLDPTMSGERLMRSGHGSATRAEMLVPLLAARGRAGR